MKVADSDFSKLRVALVYDRVNTPYGGAELVLEALHQAFPNAPLYTSVYDAERAPWARSFLVKPSMLLHNFPWLQQYHRLLAPLMPIIFEAHDLSSFDIIISITSAEAKGVLTLPHQLHVCYILTPQRYLYTHRAHYLGYLGAFPPLKWLTNILLGYLRWWDQAAQARPDYYLPISKLVANRTHSAYPRATVLPPQYPPVRVASKRLPPTHSFKKLQAQLLLPQRFEENSYILILSRLVSYKQVNIAIEGCLQANVPVLIVGTGPEENTLKERYAHVPSVAFAGSQPDKIAQDILKYSQALLMPAEEDFGITALEALAVGKLVIVHHKSGVAELLSFPQHGQNISETTPSAIKKALETVLQTHFDPLKLHKHVQQYSTDTFNRSFIEQVQTLWRRHYVTH